MDGKPAVVKKIACWWLVGLVSSLLIGVGFGIMGPPGVLSQPGYEPIWPASPTAGLPDFPYLYDRSSRIDCGPSIDGWSWFAYQWRKPGRHIHQTIVGETKGQVFSTWTRGEFRVGWPFHCLTAVRFSTVTAGREQMLPVSSWFDAGISISNGPVGSIRAFGDTVPLRPRLLYLLLDSVFWGAVLGGPYNALVWFRRFRWRRKGLCVVYGYPTQHIVGPCPECGATNDDARAS